VSAGSAAARRHAWIDLLQTSGPFLTVPVADRAWPAGLPAVPAATRATVRAAMAELIASRGARAQSVTDLVLREVLGWQDLVLSGADIPAVLSVPVPEHGLTVSADFALHLAEIQEADEVQIDDLGEGDDSDRDEAAPPATRPATTGGPWRLLGLRSPWGTHPLTRTVTHGWVANAVDRLAVLLRARDVPLGLVSDGRWWALVWAPRGRTTGAAVWDGSLWSEEPESLQAFVALLERRRFLGVDAADLLPALLDEASRAQEEVTTELGRQVRAAVEMLVTRLDELDREADGTLLDGVSDDDLYAGVVTVMMRVVFLLFAEERRLLPSDDARYDASYSVGRLLDQLRERASLAGEQTLEHRTGAWHRLLALTRALHAGVAHEDLRLPAYGGGLFDPARYPWLEGGADGRPPPVDDLTVLRMLRAVQEVELRGERRRLSFRALDVEQIGYVYEGLLELEVRTATEPVLGLHAQGRKGQRLLGLADALVAVDALEEWAATTYVGEKKLTPVRRTSARRWLARVVPVEVMSGLRRQLGPEVAARLAPLAALVRSDERGRPVVVPVGGRYVAASTRRAATGAHYTPRSLAEDIVQHTLEPLAYRPGPLDDLDAGTWRLRPSSALLELRVADIAMGSGAFLVAACRWLADRLVEAWDAEGDRDASLALAERTAGTADAEVTGVVLRARRLVAEHCLYGVDINPLAVEMAKLSLWLVTMDRERPFGFLDDRLVAGDSLLGLTSVEQLELLHMDPAAGRGLAQQPLDLLGEWTDRVRQAADLRRRITATAVVTVRDGDRKADLLRAADDAVQPLRQVADAVVGAGLHAAVGSARHRDTVFRRLQPGVWGAVDGDLAEWQRLVQTGNPPGREARRPLHWPLAFPEVFVDVPDERRGFDAIVGNPPFLGGKKVSGVLGDDYLAALQTWDGDSLKGSTDLAARFLLRADRLLAPRGQLGFVTTNTLIEGDTLEVGLLQLAEHGVDVPRGTSTRAWPSASASLSVVDVWTSKAKRSAMAVLDGEPVPNLGVDLQPFLRETGRPVRLAENDDIAFVGSLVLGLGFTMTADEAAAMIEADSRNAQVLAPYIIGADLNRRPDMSASRWVINYREWSEKRARSYPLPWAKVERDVLPERRTKNAQKYPRMVHEWWKFWQYRQGLEETITALEHVLAISRMGNVVLPVRVPAGPVYAEMCVVFALDDLGSLALLSSSVHQAWAIRYTSTLETRIHYAPSDVFLTLPRPETNPAMRKLGEALDTERREVMLDRQLGLTKLYNLVHDPAYSDRDVLRLRELIDLATLAAYGWSDLDPQVGRHRTKIGVRWTVSPAARFELLDRLLAENHARAARQ